MASRTNTSDPEAGRGLIDARHGPESLSQAIERTPRPVFDVEAYLRRLDAVPLSEEALTAVEAHETARHEKRR